MPKIQVHIYRRVNKGNKVPSSAVSLEGDGCLDVPLQPVLVASAIAGLWSPDPIGTPGV